MSENSGFGFVSGSYTEGSSVEKPDSCEGEFKKRDSFDMRPPTMTVALS